MKAVITTFKLDNGQIFQRTLRSADPAIRKDNPMSAIQKLGAIETSIESIAEQIMKRDGCSYHVAYDKALMENPSLYVDAKAAQRELKSPVRKSAADAEREATLAKIAKPGGPFILAIEKIAKETRVTGETDAQAFDRVIADRPDLYAKYEAERRQAAA